MMKLKRFLRYTKDGNQEVKFQINQISDGEIEAVITGSRLTDITPDLSDETLYISLNDMSAKRVNLNGINGREDKGDDVADELEQAIEDALDGKNRVLVKFDDDNNRFIFETTNSPNNVVPSIQFTGTALDELGINTTIARGSLDSVRESWRITVKDDATKDQTYVIHFEDENIDEKVEFTVDEDDTNEQIANRIADRLSDNDEIADDYRINVNDEEVTITAKYADDHLDVDIDITRK